MILVLMDASSKAELCEVEHMTLDLSQNCTDHGPLVRNEPLSLSETCRQALAVQGN